MSQRINGDQVNHGQEDSKQPGSDPEQVSNQNGSKFFSKSQSDSGYEQNHQGRQISNSSSQKHDDSIFDNLQKIKKLPQEKLTDKKQEEIESNEDSSNQNPFNDYLHVSVQHMFQHMKYPNGDKEEQRKLLPSQKNPFDEYHYVFNPNGYRSSRPSDSQFDDEQKENYHQPDKSQLDLQNNTTSNQRLELQENQSQKWTLNEITHQNSNSHAHYSTKKDHMKGFTISQQFGVLGEKNQIDKRVFNSNKFQNLDTKLNNAAKYPEKEERQNEEQLNQKLRAIKDRSIHEKEKHQIKKPLHKHQHSQFQDDENCGQLKFQQSDQSLRHYSHKKYLISQQQMMSMFRMQYQEFQSWSSHQHQQQIRQFKNLIEFQHLQQGREFRNLIEFQMKQLYYRRYYQRFAAEINLSQEDNYDSDKKFTHENFHSSYSNFEKKMKTFIDSHFDLPFFDPFNQTRRAHSNTQNQNDKSIHMSISRDRDQDKGSKNSKI